VRLIDVFTPRRPRVGIVSLYYAFFDAQMPPGFRQSLEIVASDYAEALSDEFEVVYAGMLCDDEDGRRANAALAASALDAIVVVPAMAAPPTPVMRSLEGIAAPLVIWNAPRIAAIAPHLTQKEATVHTTAVACVMLANTLLREGRRFAVVTANPTDLVAMTELRRSIKAVAAASALLGATALRVGEVMAGYSDVEASAAQLSELGVTERYVHMEELNAAFSEVSKDEPQILLQEVARKGWRHTPGEQDLQSARLALTLERLMDANDASFGTVNCHSPFFRGNTLIGITACLGVSLLGASGRPLSCTGDQPTALALQLAKALSGRALYSEFYTPELSTGLMLLAAGGEGDYTWSRPNTTPHLQPNGHYPGAIGEGASLSFEVDQVPATVLSLSPLDHGWRLSWATGEIVESRYPGMGGPNAMFRFDSGHVRDTGSAWISSGATHHHALAHGRLDVEIPLLAAALGVEALRV